MIEHKERVSKRAADPVAALRATLAREVPVSRLPSVIEAVERFARESLKRRLDEGRAAKKRATGRCEGRKPFGSLPGDHEALQALLYQRKTLRHSFEQAADTMNAQGFQTRTRQPWTAERVRCVYRTWIRNQKNRKRKGRTSK